jgi:hypothetical protein
VTSTNKGDENYSYNFSFPLPHPKHNILRKDGTRINPKKQKKKWRNECIKKFKRDNYIIYIKTIKKRRPMNGRR